MGAGSLTMDELPDRSNRLVSCRRLKRPMAFTLIEILVVVGIMALLVAILLPSLSRARIRARVVQVHSDLRQVTTALDSYMLCHRDKLPPTRQSCGSNILYQLPIELADQKYLPHSPDALKRSFLADVFNPGQTYRYRAPGPVWQNGTLWDQPDRPWAPRSQIWVPDDFPNCRSESGQYYKLLPGEGKCPVNYAVWSTGPDPQSPKFPRIPDTDQVDENRLPLPRSCWLERTGDTGVITHFRSASGLLFQSP